MKKFGLEKVQKIEWPEFSGGYGINFLEIQSIILITFKIIIIFI